MGSEQSSQHQQQQHNANSTIGGGVSSHQSNSGNVSKLQRGYTIANPGSSSGLLHDSSPPFNSSSRPVSPPMSVCSDSDLPYISYTDRPIGDSPKLRNKGQTNSRNTRPNPSLPKKQQSLKGKLKTSAHNVVVVNPAAKDNSLELNADLVRLKSIPMFLPVMRGTLSLPANRDPEVLERLQPIHLKNLCSTLQIHYNTNAKYIAVDQSHVSAKIKEVDYEITRIINMITEKQKLYAQYAEHFTKVRYISQQLTRCNTLLNQNIESMEQLNSFLGVDDRLEPFVWKTN